MNYDFKYNNIVKQSEEIYADQNNKSKKILQTISQIIYQWNKTLQTEDHFINQWNKAIQ